MSLSVYNATNIIRIKKPPIIERGRMGYRYGVRYRPMRLFPTITTSFAILGSFMRGGHYEGVAGASTAKITQFQEKIEKYVPRGANSFRKLRKIVLERS